MLKSFLLVFCVLLQSAAFSQEITGEELLNKSIQYHDPNNQWSKFVGELNITMESPRRSLRVSSIFFDVEKQHFKNEWKRDDDTIIQEVNKDECFISLNGRTTFTKTQEKKHRLTCEQTLRKRDYYVYLYGLPMKLKDPGTIIDPKVQKKKFKGKEYLVLKVNYEEGVGKDTWYFYFDPNTFAMEVYQFYHDETKNDGEYILLTEEVEVQGIKMPKNRAWYYNEGDKYLGTDFLFKNEDKLGF